MTKYFAIRTVVDGVSFASKAEARRYGVLKLLAAAGEISDLTLQPVIPLVVNGQTIGKYIGDFRYVENGEVVIEDVKSKPTMTSNLPPQEEDSGNLYTRDFNSRDFLALVT